MRGYQNYYSLLRYLKRSVPLEYPLSVRRVKMPNGFDGEAKLFRRKFYVRIDKALPEQSAIDTLIHEVGHCVAWHKETEHGRDWGVAYSRVYRLYLEWLEFMEGEERAYEEAAKVAHKNKTSV